MMPKRAPDRALTYVAGSAIDDFKSTSRSPIHGSGELPDAEARLRWSSTSLRMLSSLMSFFDRPRPEETDRDYDRDFDQDLERLPHGFIVDHRPPLSIRIIRGSGALFVTVSLATDGSEPSHRHTTSAMAGISLVR
jgi:hypothetical protein